MTSRKQRQGLQGMKARGLSDLQGSSDAVSACSARLRRIGLSKGRMKGRSLGEGVASVLLLRPAL